ncbi:nitrous oxide-stimulated promoter family protein [Orbus wheelerorum]|uniref:nitrous oxide-stimulated promoter family protein n=1 Tax=Orbus wheelerorum TaxID=3074111 RepID=UPI00370D9707
MVRQNYGPNIEQEKLTITCMISLYCKKKHGQFEKQLCVTCEDLKRYAIARLILCRYGEQKSTCEKCLTHCYRKDYKEKIKNVMRFSGPRMILYHPQMALKHLYKNIFHHN